MSTPTETVRFCIERRDAVDVVGPDARSYLQSQLSQRVDDLAVGASRWAFVLQPTGKVEVLGRVWCVADERFVLDTEAGFGDALLARLARFKIRVAVELAARPLSVATAWGGGGDAVVEAARDRAVVGWWGRGVHLAGWPDGPDVPDGWVAAGPDELLTARIEAGWPAMGSEIAPGESIPAETGVVAVAVDFTKGCYPGQELVERMDSRGASAPRTLRRLDVAGGAQAGDPVVVDGVEVGVLTSVTGGRALGLVRRNVEIGTLVAPPAAAPS